MKNDILVYEVEGKKVYIEGEIPAASGAFIADAGDKAVIAALDSFDNTMEPVFTFVRSIVTKINKIEIGKPTDVEIDFGIKLTSAVNCWIISGTGEGSINLKLSWKTSK